MKNRIKKFYEEHKVDFAILGSYTIVNVCLWYAIAKTADNGRQIKYLKLDNHGGPVPTDAIIHAIYKNGTHDSFSYKSEIA